MYVCMNSNVCMYALFRQDMNSGSLFRISTKQEMSVVEDKAFISQDSIVALFEVTSVNACMYVCMYVCKYVCKYL
jgi:hypothetical protein